MAVQPWEWAMFPVGVTHAGVDFGMDLFGKKKPRGTPDISAELAKIGALFEAQRTAAKAAINQDAAETRTAASNNMATRGVYRSPVSENVYGKIDQNRSNALAQAMAQIGGAEASTRAGLLSHLLELDNQNKIAADQANSAKMSQLFGLGSSLLLAGLMGPAGPAAGVVSKGALSAVNPGGGATSPALLPSYENDLVRKLYGGAFNPAPTSPAMPMTYSNMLARRLYAGSF